MAVGYLKCPSRESILEEFDLCVARLCCPACETMPGHAGGRQGLLPDQQELRQRPPGAGTPLPWGEDDGGENSTVAYHSSGSYLYTCVFFHSDMSHLLKESVCL